MTVKVKVMGYTMLFTYITRFNSKAMPANNTCHIKIVEIVYPIIWGPLHIVNRSRCKSFTVAKLNCNSLENICGWMVVLYGQSLLHRLFNWKKFAVTN